MDKGEVLLQCPHCDEDIIVNVASLMGTLSAQKRDKSEKERSKRMQEVANARWNKNKKHE